MNEIFGSFGDLVVARPIEHCGSHDMSFGGRLNPALQIHEDGGESGCGGKVWVAGELLCDYIVEKSDEDDLLANWDTSKVQKFRNIIELGSGTGLVGLCVALLEKQFFHKGIKVTITDIDQLVPLMQKNIELNCVNTEMIAEELWWGEPLSGAFAPHSEGLSKVTSVDLILAADCVYLEKAFPLLEKTLLDLTNCSKPPVILMAYRKRRNADKRFFRKIGKHFTVREITDFSTYDQYLKQRTHLFELIRN
ncbi:putative protein-lysine N-methyltransferase KNAG_0H01980 [Huiozyma naganishii CBS 8797]|uniref:Protein-lysine N-methyltransferase EFM6 n=1 Tax=Huiozyma naganishii (strain ATCC MYA-139 / BCRC 22969 / CBS 8797 / KCTC 17520 / NBRC 10181 / NCYC 3082 / Yp74L-3) TaxID=1071383 RepID=J7S1S8_HUIN7|nr:hypothetical protein KNAG_0H01980 [Kazachstania naganishii CBS 8797]CCK71612.1 hypothetical protein KNAG_0H01980 [Kazachstania naganishii CBS 8797]